MPSEQRGRAIGMSMYSSILASELNKYLTKVVAHAALNAGLPKRSLPLFLQGVAARSFQGVPGLNSKILQAIAEPRKNAYALSLRTVWLFTLGFGAITIIAAFFTPNMTDYLNDEVARKLQGYRNTADVSDKIATADEEKVENGHSRH